MVHETWPEITEINTLHKENENGQIWDWYLNNNGIL